MNTLKNFYLVNKKISLGVLLVLLVILLVACGGSKTTTGVITNSDGSTSTAVYIVGDKNEGGITYTAGDGSLLDKHGDDKITNAYGVPDRVLKGIDSMYQISTPQNELKKEQLVKYSRFYTSILELKNSSLPKTKIEAEKVMYPQSIIQEYCKNSPSEVFTNLELEEAYGRIYLANIHNKEKLARYAEIRDLATVQYPGKFCSN
jgi:hypothetical protein